MLRVLLFIIIVLAVTFSLNSMLDSKEVLIGEYNNRVLSFTYYETVFDNIVNSGLFDELYNYKGFISNGNLYSVSRQSLFPLYVLTYYDEDTEQYALSLTYGELGVYTPTSSPYLDYSNGNVVSINSQNLEYFREKMDELHQNLKINMVIYYDIYKVYENQCHSPVKYSFETIYIDKYGLMHIVRIIFC